LTGIAGTGCRSLVDHRFYLALDEGDRGGHGRYFQRAGYTKLQGKCGSDNCFDGVYSDGKNIIINEAKPLGANGTISLNGASGNLPTQMTDRWVQSAIGRLRASGDPAAMRTANMLTEAINNGTLIKVVTASREQTALIVKVK